ncbi:MAG: hypothetical protein Q9162_000693 [Coniocarpon cinnabarinum]
MQHQLKQQASALASVRQTISETTSSVDETCSIFTENSTQYQHFTFDDEIVNSTVYRNALKVGLPRADRDTQGAENYGRSSFLDVSDLDATEAQSTKEQNIEFREDGACSVAEPFSIIPHVSGSRVADNHTKTGEEETSTARSQGRETNHRNLINALNPQAPSHLQPESEDVLLTIEAAWGESHLHRKQDPMSFHAAGQQDRWKLKGQIWILTYRDWREAIAINAERGMIYPSDELVWSELYTSNDMIWKARWGLRIFPKNEYRSTRIRILLVSKFSMAYMQEYFPQYKLTKIAKEFTMVIICCSTPTLREQVLSLISDHRDSISSDISRKGSPKGISVTSNALYVDRDDSASRAQDLVAQLGRF